jgi:hypothetical protein
VNPARGLQWLDLIRQARSKKPPARCPRIFVSHRQADGAAALRLAWLAQDEGWGYWLDILDLASAPRQLAALLGRAATPLQMSIFTAALIEMGLLNCNQVITAMTDNTSGRPRAPSAHSSAPASQGQSRGNRSGIGRSTNSNQR